MNKEERNAKKKIWDAAYRERHRERIRESQRKWQSEHREAVRAFGRKSQRKRYGCVNPHGESRFGTCLICQVDKPLVYDHDHSTGEFRGWLCTRCNTALGIFERNRKRIEQYLDCPKSFIEEVR